MKFLILNGPNLNLMRWSEPGVPGELDYNAIMDYVQAGCEQLGIETDCCQTNHEGDLVDEIQAAAGRVDGIVLNPGAYAHYSVAILDALRLCGVPAVEVCCTPRTSGSPSARRTWCPLAVRAISSGKARRATCTPASIWPSCCAPTAPARRIS